MWGGVGPGMPIPTIILILWYKIDIPLLDNTKYSHWDMYYDSVGCERIRYRVIQYSGQFHTNKTNHC